jgi:uncharacterized membrane protein/Flp pilus assembly protein TadD
MMNKISSRIDALDWSERLGFLGTGMILFATSMDLWAQNRELQSEISLLAVAFLWVGGVGLFILGMANVRKRPQILLLFALISAQFAYYYLYQQSYSPLTASHTDNEMITRFAVEALRTGQNPYAWNFTDSTRVFHDRGMNTTPFLDGASQYRLTYPALPIFVLFIFDQIGIVDVRVVMFLFQLTLLCLLFFSTPRSLRPLILLPLYIQKDFVFLSLAGVQDVVWSVMLIGVILLKNRSGWRAVLFGLAAAYRQQPWFIAPFLLIEMYDTHQDSSQKWREVIRFVIISSLTFLIVNLPFILWDPSAWILGVFEPAYATFNVFSHGFGALSTYGLTPYTRQFFTTLQFVIYLSFIIIYTRHVRSLGFAYWLFPAFFFWFYYRGLSNYWLYWIPPLLVALSQNPTMNIVPRNRQKERFTIVWIAWLALPMSLWAIWLLFRPPLVSLEYDGPLYISNYGQLLVDEMSVTVVNHSNRPMTPRFALQRDAGVQALPWLIENGPETLPPGETGHYLISAPTPSRAFPVETGGQLVVADAGNDYDLRALATIPAEHSFSTADAIINPAYQFWFKDADTPTGWGIKRTPQGSEGDITLEKVDSVLALDMEVVGNQTNTPGMTQLVQWIPFDHSFSISLYPTFTTDNPQQEGYGIELDDGFRKLWVMFGDRSDSGVMDKNHHYLMIEAPLNQWSDHHISPKDLFASQGWDPPPIGLRNQGGLSIQTRQIQMSLFVRSTVSSRSIAFGLILQEPIATNTWVQQQIIDPVDYYIQLGNEYRLQRNYQLAEAAYLQALALDKANPEVFFGLGETHFWEDDWDGALANFEKSLNTNYLWEALAYRGMGWSYYNLGQYDEAEFAFSKAVLLDPNMTDSINGLGWVKLQQAKCANAILFFEQALSLDAQLRAAQDGITLCVQDEHNE